MRERICRISALLLAVVMFVGVAQEKPAKKQSQPAQDSTAVMRSVKDMLTGINNEQAALEARYKQLETVKNFLATVKADSILMAKP